MARVCLVPSQPLGVTSVSFPTTAVARGRLEALSGHFLPSPGAPPDLPHEEMGSGSSSVTGWSPSAWSSGFTHVRVRGNVLHALGAPRTPCVPSLQTGAWVPPASWLSQTVLLGTFMFTSLMGHWLQLRGVHPQEWKAGLQGAPGCL